MCHLTARGGGRARRRRRVGGCSGRARLALAQRGRWITPMGPRWLTSVASALPGAGTAGRRPEARRTHRSPPRDPPVSLQEVGEVELAQPFEDEVGMLARQPVGGRFACAIGARRSSTPSPGRRPAVRGGRSRRRVDVTRRAAEGRRTWRRPFRLSVSTASGRRQARRRPEHSPGGWPCAAASARPPADAHRLRRCRRCAAA